MFMGVAKFAANRGVNCKDDPYRSIKAMEVALV